MGFCDDILKDWEFPDFMSLKEYVWNIIKESQITQLSQIFPTDEDLNAFKESFFEESRESFCNFVDSLPELKQKVIDSLNGVANKKPIKKDIDKKLLMKSPKKKQKLEKQEKEEEDDDDVLEIVLFKKSPKVELKTEKISNEKNSLKKSPKTQSNTSSAEKSPKSESKAERSNSSSEKSPKTESKSKKLHKSNSSESEKILIEIDQESIGECLNIGAFDWNRNSCYMDSTLFSLILCNQQWTFDNLLSKKLTQKPFTFNQTEFKNMIKQFITLLKDVEDLEDIEDSENEIIIQISNIVNEILEELNNDILQINFYTIRMLIPKLRSLSLIGEFNNTSSLEKVLDNIKLLLPSETICVAKNPKDDVIRREAIQQKMIALYNNVVYNPDRTNQSPITSCDDIRLTFKKCVTSNEQKVQNAWWSDDMQDPYDLIDYLFKIFEVENTFKAITTVYGLSRITKEWVKSSETLKSSNVYLLNRESLPDSTRIASIINGLEEEDDVEFGEQINLVEDDDGEIENYQTGYLFTRRKVKESIKIDGKLFVFHYRRVYEKEEVVDSSTKTDLFSEKILNLLNKYKAGLSVDSIVTKTKATKAKVLKAIDILLNSDAITRGVNKSRYVLSEENDEQDISRNSIKVLTSIEKLPKESKKLGFNASSIIKSSKLTKKEIEIAFKELKLLNFIKHPISDTFIAKKKSKFFDSKQSQIIKNTSIIPEEYIVNSSGQKLFLTACILFKASHYTAVFRCRGFWFLYNDMESEKFQMIGKNLEDALRWNDGALKTNTVIWFYGEQWL